MQNYHHILRGLKTLTDENGEFVGFDRSNDQSDKYAVHYLPTKYLIAADGTIIGKIGNDEQLDSVERRRLDRTHHGADNFADIHAYTS